jgi:hypothetical protein
MQKHFSLEGVFCCTETDTNMENYETDDILIASFLLVKGARLLELRCIKIPHVVFVFEDIVACSQLHNDYLNNGQAPARELFARREELMSAVRDRNRYRDNRYGRD